jgi:hypothetical protein
MTESSGAGTQTAPETAPAVNPSSGIDANDEPGKGNGDPKRNASPAVVAAFGIYLLTLSVLLFYLVLKLMPGIATDTGPGTVNLFGLPGLRIWPETRFILLALCAGALGSFIHTATSFADFVGNQQLVKSWLWWYLLRPFIGSCLAMTLYFAIRAGLMPAQGTSGLNPFGVVTIAALAGMFAKQATDKLREIFENLFKSTPPPRADELKPSAAAAAAAGGKK